MADTYRDRGIEAPLRFADLHPEMFEIRYEDLVDENFEQLSRRLGLCISGTADVGAGVQPVVRTKRYGNWRDWCTPTDVALFKPVLQPYLDRYYPEADWTLNARPAISPDHSSRYVHRILTERRQQLAVFGGTPWPSQ